jgi:hypothetical protein
LNPDLASPRDSLFAHRCPARCTRRHRPRAERKAGGGRLCAPPPPASSSARGGRGGVTTTRGPLAPPPRQPVPARPLGEPANSVAEGPDPQHPPLFHAPTRSPAPPAMGRGGGPPTRRKGKAGWQRGARAAMRPALSSATVTRDPAACPPGCGVQRRGATRPLGSARMFLSVVCAECFWAVTIAPRAAVCLVLPRRRRPFPGAGGPARGMGGLPTPLPAGRIGPIWLKKKQVSSRGAARSRRYNSQPNRQDSQLSYVLLIFFFSFFVLDSFEFQKFGTVVCSRKLLVPIKYRNCNFFSVS